MMTTSPVTRVDRILWINIMRENDYSEHSQSLTEFRKYSNDGNNWVWTHVSRISSDSLWYYIDESGLEVKYTETVIDLTEITIENIPDVPSDMIAFDPALIEIPSLEQTCNIKKREEYWLKKLEICLSRFEN